MPRRHPDDLSRWPLAYLFWALVCLALILWPCLAYR